MPSDLPASVRLDPALCLAPGLFRSLPPGERSCDGVELAYQHGATTLTFRMPTPLGCDDMRILQAIVALGPRDPLAIGEATRSEPLVALRGRLELAGDARAMDVLVVRTGFAELVRAAGYGQGGDVHGGGLRKHLGACLRRLAAVEVEVREPDPDGRGERMMGWRLVAHDLAEDGKCGSLAIALNPRLSQSALARRPFTHVDLRVARSLRTNPARLLHQRLSALVGSKHSGGKVDAGRNTAAAGPAKAIRIDTMMGYVWTPPEASGPVRSDGAALSSGSVRKRRALIMAALEALEAAGWTVEAVPNRPNTRLISQFPIVGGGSGSAPRPLERATPELRSGQETRLPGHVMRRPRRRVRSTSGGGSGSGEGHPTP